VYDFFVDFQWL